ncbi:MAG: BrnT family toxin, partial [Thiomargarita sp.]|nr:BrnT family toxin [Thiomargarita sp.]
IKHKFLVPTLARGNEKICSLGLLKEKVVMVVWTPRGDNDIHLISVRKATKNETKRFWKETRL